MDIAGFSAASARACVSSGLCVKVASVTRADYTLAIPTITVVVVRVVVAIAP
jgi:hypothetical protein